MEISILSKVLEIGITIFLILYAVIFHEIAHGWAAVKLSDPTPKLQKRLTLNPLRHLDLFGSVLIPLISILFFGFVFGWAKPVQIESKNFKNPQRDMGIVGLAGPAANFLCALISGFIIRIIFQFAEISSFGYLSFIFITVLNLFAFINILLGVFNLIPIPPLDGGHIISAFLPMKIREEIWMAAPFLFIITIFLLFSLGQNLFLPFIKHLHQFITNLPII